jgi:hypothetical protein
MTVLKRWMVEIDDSSVDVGGGAMLPAKWGVVENR